MPPENTSLQVGDTTQTVEVIATTPALQTDSSTLRDIVSAQAVQDLPLNGRNFITLVETTVGAAAGPSNSAANFAAQRSSIAGTCCRRSAIGFGCALRLLSGG